MSKRKLTPRQKNRLRKAFPAGLFVGLLTGAAVILIGVCLQLEPLVILRRSAASALLLGCLVSLGVSIVRLTDAEYRSRKSLER